VDPDTKPVSSEPRAAQPDLKAIRKAAYFLIGKGYTPLPLPGGAKRPTLTGWQNVSVSIKDVDQRFTEGCNIGLRLDTVTDVDLDCPEALALAPFFLKPTGAIWGRKTAPRSHHIYDVKESRHKEFADPTIVDDRKKMVVEIRNGNGHQSMAPPSVHPETGEQLEWVNGFQPAEWNYHELRRAVGKIAAGVLLVRNLHEGIRHHVWLYLGGAMCRAEWEKNDAGHFATVLAQAMNFKTPEDWRRDVEDSFKEDKEKVAGLKKLEEYLDKRVVRCLAEWLDLRRAKCDPLDLTDDANAHAIFTRHGEDLHYLRNEGKGGLWTFWNDVIWQRDRAGRVNHLAADTLKKKSDELTAASRDARFIEKVRRELLNVPGVCAALERLSWYPEIYVEPNEFDADPWLVGLENGIYNLQLDQLEGGSREHLVSRQVHATYDPGAMCPRWLACIERAQPNPDVRSFLQRLAGSCLLGMQTEHGFVFNYGKGANFKTAFAEAIRRVMGEDYAATPNEGLFFKGNQDVPLNYVADIHGMRLLTTSEKNEGSEWNIEFIKRLLGGQELVGRRLYCEAFCFVPTAHIIAAANNRPRLNEFDEALRRRFLLVPWDVTIPKDGEMLASVETNPDVIIHYLRSGARIPFEQLMALLLEERDGILGWMLAGARDFIKRGLRLEPPASVLAATENYFEDEDLMGRFVRDWCAVIPVPENLTDMEVARFLQQAGKGSDSGALHEAFTAWSQFGKHAWGKRKVAQRLEKVEGVVAKRGGGNRTFLNLVLNAAARETMAASLGPGDHGDMPF
jgi:P4 family phage/plasmid primase-like protien